MDGDQKRNTEKNSMSLFIGEKKIKQAIETKEKTESTGVSIIKVEFEDGSIEHFSKLMFDKIKSIDKCDLSQLRDKRVGSVVEIVLGVMRDWGLKIGELPYFASLLNQSLNYNSDNALLKLVSKYGPKPKSLDDIDYVTIDRILRDGKSKNQK